MKLVQILVITALLFSFSNANRDGKFYLEKTITPGMTENKPFFAEGRELARVVLDGLKDGKISSFRYILGRLDQPRMIQRQNVLKRLEVKTDLFAGLDDDDEEKGDETVEYYEADQMHFRVLEEVQVEGNKISSSSPLWIDLFVSGRHKTDGIDHYVGSFRYKDCLELFREDSRTEWINPFNHGQRTNFSKAIEMGLYRAEVLSVMNDNADEVFFSTVDFGGDEVKQAEPFIKDVFQAMTKGGLDAAGLPAEETYLSYKLERLIDLNDPKNKPLFNDDQNVVVSLYEAGASGDIPLHYKKVDGTLAEQDLNAFTSKFTTERGLDSVNIPIEKLDQVVIVESMKEANGKQSYEVEYLGLLVPEDLTYSGFPAYLGYLRFEDCKSVLENLKADQQNIFQLISNRGFGGTTSLEVTSVFGDKATITKDTEAAPPGFTEDELKSFKAQIGN